ncbi:MAG: cupredoxin family copper-binding protein [Pseudomonadota bacterium]
MSTSKVTLVIATAFLTGFLGACSSLSEFAQSGYYDHSVSGSSSAEADVPEGAITIAISNFAYSPAQQTVSAGDTIVFVNEDGAPHSATATDGSFDTGVFAGGESGSITVSSVGTYDYFCSVHPNMKGTLVVEE